MVLAKNAGLAIFSTEYVRRAFSRIACNTYNLYLTKRNREKERREKGTGEEVKRGEHILVLFDVISNNEKSMISLMFKVFGGENRNLLQITQFHKSIIESKSIIISI